MGSKIQQEKSKKLHLVVNFFFAYPLYTVIVAHAMKKWTHFKYLYYDYFTVIRFHSSNVYKWRENEQIIFIHCLLYQRLTPEYFTLFFFFSFSDRYFFVTDGRTDGRRNTDILIVYISHTFNLFVDIGKTT